MKIATFRAELDLDVAEDVLPVSNLRVDVAACGGHV